MTFNPEDAKPDDLFPAEMFIVKNDKGQTSEPGGVISLDEAEQEVEASSAPVDDQDEERKERSLVQQYESVTEVLENS